MKQTCKIRFERPNELTLFEEHSLSKKMTFKTLTT